ncbi:MAG: DUF1080 domain-containing protein [bacterium]|nr:DUF1080 domain-containing protein [bacterium]
MKKSALLRLLPVLALLACNTGTEPEGVLFSDDFSGHSDGSFPDGWTQFDLLLHDDSPPGLWYVQDGELVEANDTWGGYNDPDWYYQEGTVVLAGDENWGDYRLTVDVTPAVTGGLAIYCRTTVDANQRLEYYRVFITNDEAYGGPFWRLDHRGGLEYTVLKRKDDVGYIPGETFRVIIEVTGNLVRVYSGHRGNLVLEWDGGEGYSYCHTGEIALMAFRNPGIAFDNVLIEEL